MSDRIAVMLDGHIEQLADPDTIYDHPATAFVAGFIGQQNFFEGTAQRRRADASRATDGRSVHAVRSRSASSTGGAALAAVRPEAITLAATRARPTPTNAVSGTLASVSHLGDVIQFVVLTPGRKEILARLPRPSAPRLDVGGEVWCAWDAEHTHVFAADQADIVLADPAGEVPAAVGDGYDEGERDDA